MNYMIVVFNIWIVGVYMGCFIIVMVFDFLLVYVIGYSLGV